MVKVSLSQTFVISIVLISMLTMEPTSYSVTTESMFENDSIPITEARGGGGGGGWTIPSEWYEIPCFHAILRREVIGVNVYFFPPEYLLQFSHFYSFAEYVVRYYVSTIVAILGILLNTSFLFVVARVREMRTVTNAYLAVLAATDIVFLVVSTIEIVKIWLTNPVLVGHQPFTSDAGCLANFLATSSSFYGSVCMVTLVTFERFMAICFPLKHRMVGGKRYTVTMVSFTMLVAITMGFITALKSAKSISYCTMYPPGFQKLLSVPLSYESSLCIATDDIRASFSFLEIGTSLRSLFFLTNLAINLLLYAAIIVRLGQRNVGGEGNQERRAEVNRIRNQVARMLIINGTIFYLLMLPYEFITFTNAVAAISQNKYKLIVSSMRNKIQHIGTLCRFINSSVNPIIYGLSNARYRKAYAKAFGCDRDVKGTNRSQTGISVVSVTRQSQNEVQSSKM